MNVAAFEIVLIRPARMDGQQFGSGAKLQAEARAAFELIASRRARLADPNDLPRLIRAIGEHRPAVVQRSAEAVRNERRP